MNTDEVRYQLASRSVVADIIDGEAIIMHLGEGAYYSIAGAGAAAWSLLLAGATCSEAAHAIAASTGAPAELVTTGIRALLARVPRRGCSRPIPSVSRPPSSVSNRTSSTRHRSSTSTAT